MPSDLIEDDLQKFDSFDTENFGIWINIFE